MSSESSNANDRISIGRIPLKQVRVSRDREKQPPPNPMNRLVPYLDLFCRLGDAELARLAGVDESVCASLRQQVVMINEGLAAYVDLLPRLGDAELVRLTGASDKTIRFWRLCQPAKGVSPTTAPAVTKVKPEHTGAGVPEHSERAVTAPHSPVASPSADKTGPFPSTEALGNPGDPDAAGYVTLSGAPFPGFDNEDGQSGSEGGPALEGVSLEEDDPLGLNE